MDLAVVILAAGKGKRMTSELPKVLHTILGRPLIDYVLDAISGIMPCPVVVVCGYKSEDVKGALGDRGTYFAHQAEQLGTGHAVLCAMDRLRDFRGHVLILNGDLPLMRESTLDEFVASHESSGATVSILTAELDDPFGYGRVARDKGGRVSKVVEEKDASPDERGIKEVNAGAYCVEAGFLMESLEGLNPNNEQHEYYLPDIVGVAVKSGAVVNGMLVEDPREVLGVNTRAELAGVEEVLRRRIIARLMDQGVTVVDPASTHIAPGAQIGVDTVIHPNTFIYGKSSIGWGCSIGPSVWIEDSEIGHECTVRFSTYITGALVRDNVTIGPFAHLRPGTQVHNGAKIGNFVEIKKSVVGRGSKVPHLSYVGDATLGEGVNIGAGSITCNYDGIEKHRTIIEDDVFIGSDTMLVAPVSVGKGATTAAGSTITKDVPPGSLAVGRAKQFLIRDWQRKPGKKGTDPKKDG